MEKKKAEEQARLEKEREQKRIEEERKRVEAHEKWIEEYQDRALRSWLPWGIEIPTTLKFQIKDAIRKALANRSKDEDRWEIERLVKETVSIIIQPFLDAEKAKKKVQLIQRWALPEVENYIKAQGLEAYVDEESKEKIREYVHNHFIKVLVGNEVIISSSQVTDFLDTFFKPIREKIRDAQEKERR